MQVMRLMTVILGGLRCATTAVLSLLYGGARAVSADDRYSLGHSARHNSLAPGHREADLATEELRLAADGIAEHGLDGRCRL
jgi:hypothetical protein